MNTVSKNSLYFKMGQLSRGIGSSAIDAHGTVRCSYASARKLMLAASPQGTLACGFEFFQFGRHRGLVPERETARAG